MRLRSRSVMTWVLLVLGMAACLVVAYGAYTLAGYAWDQVVDYKSPYVRQPGSADTSPTTVWVPTGLQASYNPSSPVLAKRVVLVIVDGMRDDVSRTEMSTLNKLRTHGADIALTAPQPSLSYPNWTTILTGATQDISGVTTNWFEGRVPAPTLMDVAEQSGHSVEVVGPEDFATLFGVRTGPNVSLRPWPKGGYLTTTLVDDALRIAKTSDPRLIVVHLPDLDEAGHEHGGGSPEYRAVAKRMDIDLARLVDGLQREDTAFVIVADHGHIDTGGHGGWEQVVTTVPGVFAGAGIKLGSGEGRLEQIASTVAALTGTPVPAYSSAGALRSTIGTTAPALFLADDRHRVAFSRHYVDVVTEGNSTINSARMEGTSADAAEEMAAQARTERQAIERSQRLLLGLAAFGAALLVIGAIGVASWRGLVSAIAGMVGYYVAYNLMFFTVHGYNWSLSAFNTETMVESFMNGRMVEAIIAGLVGAATAALVYPYLREQPRSSRDPWFRSGWLALGPATILVIQATLAMQVAWYYWWYGFSISWVLPDFMWAFKADLDMVQATALGAAALLAPLVTYLIGRYHPKIARVRVGGRVAGSKT